MLKTGDVFADKVSGLGYPFMEETAEGRKNRAGSRCANQLYIVKAQDQHCQTSDELHLGAVLRKTQGVGYRD